MVATNDCDPVPDGELRVYAGTGSGFGDGLAWRAPDLGLDEVKVWGLQPSVWGNLSGECSGGREAVGFFREMSGSAAMDLLVPVNACLDQPADQAVIYPGCVPE